MHPILFRIGDFVIPTYGIMIMLGVVAAVAVALPRARRLGIKADDIYDLTFVALISGFVGARALFMIVNFRDFQADPLGMIFSRSGFVFLGGLLAAIPALYIAIERKKLARWDVADLGAPSAALAHALGRIGCFLAGCCYGAVCSSEHPLGVRFPVLRGDEGEILFSWAWQDHVERGLIDASALQSASVLPTQLFEAAANLIIFSALMLGWRRRKFAGQIFVIYLALYGIIRFGLEFMRGDLDRGVHYGLSTSQYLSLAALGAACVLGAVLRAGAPVRRAGAMTGK